MTLKTTVSSVKWCLFVTIVCVLNVINAANNSGSEIEPGSSFLNYWNSNPRDYNRVISITTYLGNVLKIIINRPRENMNPSKIDDKFIKNIVYLFDGFKFADSITKNINNYTNLMDKLLLTPKYKKTMGKFFIILQTIETVFDNYLNHIHLYYDTDNAKLEYFFDKTIKNSEFRESIMLMDYFHEQNYEHLLIRKEIDKNIFQLYFEALRMELNYQELCGLTITKLLFDFYERVLIDVIKANTIMIIGYEFFRLSHPGYAIQAIQYSYYTKYMQTTKKILYSTSGLHVLITLNHATKKNCDPAVWKESVNYIRVKNYVSDHSGFVATHSRGFKPRSNVDEEYECDDYALYSNFKSESFDSLRCPEVFEITPQSCPLSRSEEFTLPGIDYSNWNVTCYEKTSYSSIFKEFCYCDQHSDTMLSIRTLSLREQLTDSNDNRVVTGIRFAVVSNVISLEIQEGKLVNGTIDPNSVQWVRQRGRDPKNGPATIKLGFNVKSFNLDDIELPSEYFVTGVKFKLLEDNHIGLVVRGTQMSDDIKLRSSLRHRWFYPIVSSRDPREKIYINDYRNSAEILTKNSEISHSGANYVDLSVGISSTIFNNLPVIPFLDSQNLESNPPSPLGGLGFFYKGQPGYGGFLAFKLISSLYRFDTHSDLIYFTDS